MDRNFLRTDPNIRRVGGASMAQWAGAAGRCAGAEPWWVGVFGAGAERGGPLKRAASAGR